VLGILDFPFRDCFVAKLLAMTIKGCHSDGSEESNPGILMLTGFALIANIMN